MPLLIRALLFVALLIGVCGPAVAQDDPRAEALRDVFFDWAEAEQMQAPEIVITRDGAPILHEAQGVEPGTPRLLASLTKSLTAQCVAGLVEEGRLRWDAPMSDLLGWTGEAGAIPLSALVTQSGGLRGDRTQTAMPGWLEGQGDWRLVSQWTRPLHPEPAFAYSNENYALLGTVIERVTGVPFERACDGVLPSASPSEQVATFGPMGGWQAPLQDYAQFHALLYGNRPPEGPTADLDGGAIYGLGMYGRPLDGGWIWWHIGALCIPGQVDTTSYALTLPGGWGLALAADSCPDFEALAALDRAFWEVMSHD
ncbi:serine hydrolase [Pararhodobacter sp. CCB-MM2]|uniref:serine hydrolase domain-containing protein n=1 Tax=Pararhodobacter sp. CCB-MM2 TaxID=1786003 RepID=UPI0013141024|nr:serine hydrolase domain-containing protein [Pararhodobacter sp. CCB-MM2]